MVIALTFSLVAALFVLRDWTAGPCAFLSRD
jgi:hypothetical protein